MTKMIEVDHATFPSEVLQSPVPVAVDFYGDYCGPCRLLKPLLEALAADLTHARIVTVDEMSNQELVRDYGVKAVPTVLVFRDGREVHRMVGLAGMESLRDALGE